MGKVIKAHQLSPASKSGCLVVYVNPSEDIVKASISVGKKVATALMNIEPHRRAKELDGVWCGIVASLPDGLTVTDMDVLFNPAYEIDVLRLLETSYRRKLYSIIWPGRYACGKLTYSEIGYDDYQEYDTSDYDILCAW